MADNSIALGIRPMAVPDYAASTMNRVNMMGALAKMDEYKAGVAEKNALAQLVTQPGFDPSSTESQNMILRVAPTTGPGILKGLTETRTAGVGLKSAEFELQKKQRDDAILAIATLNTPDEALASLQKHMQDGSIGKEQAQSLAQAITGAPDFNMWKTQTIRGLLTAAQQAQQTFTNQNLGGSIRQIATPTYGGGPAVVVPGSTGTVTATPGEVMSNATTRRGQDFQNDPNVLDKIVTDSAGNVTKYNKFGQVIGTDKGVGKPSATFEKTRVQREQLNKDLDRTISELERATQKGGLIETATGSGAGALRDVAKGFFGVATEGSVAIGALKPIYDMVLKMVPRFEGPQSEKDVVSYQDAAGNLANPNTPTATKLAAAKEILRLMKARKGQFVTRDMAEGSGIVADGVDTSNPFLK
jgi:hypothetical protein